MKKKVVILSAFATPFRSGAEACAEEVAAQLQDQFDITIITSRLRKDLPALDTLPSGVRVWRVGIGSSIDKWLYPFLAPKAAKALKPDVIHAVLETFAGLALLFCKLKGVKRILTMQTTNRSFLKGPIVRSPNVVTAISSVLVEQAKKFGRKDVHLIPNGIRLQEIKEASEKFPKISGRILFVGRLEQMKGVDTLLTAFADIRLQKSDFRFQVRVVGDGSQRKKLEEQSRQLHIQNHVLFTGALPYDQVFKEYAEAEIFCGLSRSEALGNVFLEAQAAGCAVVATNVGGIPDIVKDGVTGLLVSPNDPKAAADAIEKLLHHPTLRHELSEAGKKNAEQYDWAGIAKQYRDLY